MTAGWLDTWTSGDLWSSTTVCSWVYFYLQICKELLMWPSTDPQKVLDPHPLGVEGVFAFYTYHPQWIHPNVENSHRWRGGGAPTWTYNSGVVPAWTNGTDLRSQVEWPYLLHGQFNLKYILTVNFMLDFGEAPFLQSQASFLTC